jgi:hypothetical protein
MLCLTSSTKVAREDDELHIRDSVVAEHGKLDLILLHEGRRDLALIGSCFEVLLELVDHGGGRCRVSLRERQEGKRGDTGSVKTLANSTARNKVRG